jgi:hypothetical protein
MRRCAWLLLVGLVACGSRTPLRLTASGDDDANAAGANTSAAAASGSGGAGASGGGATGGNATGGSGTGGETELSCLALEQNGELLMLPTLPEGGAELPVLHALGDGRTAVVFRWIVAEGPAAIDRVASMTLDWTGAWPPSMEPMVELVPNAASFAVDRGPSSLLGLLTRTDPALAGVSFGFADADVGGWGPLVATADDATRAVFVAPTSSGRHFVGMQRPGGFTEWPSFELLVGWVHQPPNGVQYEGPIAAGCVDQPLAADALETSEGWLLARAMPVGGTCFDDTPPAPATVLTVTRWTDGGELFGLEVPQPGPIEALAMVPRSSGAWVAYLRQGEILEAVRMDDQGLLELGPVPLTTSTESAFSFGAAGLGGGMVIAFVDEPGNAAADLVVEATDAMGVITATAEIDSPPLTHGAPAVAFDAATRQVLVAFTGYVDSPPGSAVFVARFACR